MRRPVFIARQSRCPTGMLGRLITWVMERETAPENDAALACLDPQPTDHVLEIGFGPGYALSHLIEHVDRGCVAGVDVSKDVVRRAAAGFGALIDRGRVELRVAEAESLPFDGGRFDAVLSVHTLYFWPSIARSLAEIRRVLKQEGRLVLGYRPPDDPATASFPADIYRFVAPSRLELSLCAAGFVDASSRYIEVPSGRLVLTVARAG